MHYEISRLAEQVLKQVEGEKRVSPEQNAVMCAETLYRGDLKVFWMYNLPLRRQTKFLRGMTGSVVGVDLQTEVEQRYTQTGNHIALCKNELLGGEIIKNGFTPFSYTAPAGTFAVEVNNMTDYHPNFRPSLSDAVDGKIRVKGFADIRFSSLRKKLETLQQELKKLEMQNELASKTVTDEAERLRERIQRLEDEIASEEALQQRYIRESTELRMQPILDSEQETVKRSKILDGHLIIDGGPGTGKTTTLIQRINFLTASTIAEYRSDIFGNELTELEGNWRFFSPSRLLRAFLRNSMAEEGLTSSDTNTKVWHDYLDDVFKYYQLFNSSTQGPFVKARRFSEPVIPNDASILKELYKSIETALLSDIKNQLNRMLDFNTEGLAWSNQADEMKKLVRKALTIDSIAGLVQQFESWKTQYRDRVTKNAKNLSDTLNTLSSRAQVIVTNKKPELIDDILIYLRERFDKKNERYEDQLDVDDTVDFDESELKTYNPDLELDRFFRSFTTEIALASLKTGARRSEPYRQWYDKLSFVYENLDVRNVAEQLYYRQFASILINGSGRTVFNRIPSVYKKNRQNLSQILASSGFDSERFQNLVEDEKSRLHIDEMNLILWFINGIIKDIWKSSLSVLNKIEHKYVNAWYQEQKYVIAIDEASDFSLVEIAAISSFSHPKYNSVTLSGDLMQRMTDYGLSDWKQLKLLFPDLEQGRLTVSYRQSPILLGLAGRLYKNVTGKNPEFRSYLPESKAEPAPVIERHETTISVVNWLEDQILRVYSMYSGKIPSVAIFAENDASVDIISRELAESDKLNDIGITVRGSRSDAELISDTQVCVYNIKTIKGLEFEAVFFVNLDCISVQDDSLLQKYLYVGLSRASYYLGISYKEKLPESVGFLIEGRND
jgi:hypothetical protein